MKDVFRLASSPAFMTNSSFRKLLVTSGLEEILDVLDERAGEDGLYYAALLSAAHDMEKFIASAMALAQGTSLEDLLPEEAHRPGHLLRIWNAYRLWKKVTFYGSARADTPVPAKLKRALDLFFRQLALRRISACTGGGRTGLIGEVNTLAQIHGVRLLTVGLSLLDELAVGDEVSKHFSASVRTGMTAILGKTIVEVVLPGSFGTMYELITSIVEAREPAVIGPYSHRSHLAPAPPIVVLSVADPVSGGISWESIRLCFEQQQERLRSMLKQRQSELAATEGRWRFHNQRQVESMMDWLKTDELFALAIEGLSENQQPSVPWNERDVASLRLSNATAFDRILSESEEVTSFYTNTAEKVRSIKRALSTLERIFFVEEERTVRMGSEDPDVRLDGTVFHLGQVKLNEPDSVSAFLGALVDEEMNKLFSSPKESAAAESLP